MDLLTATADAHALARHGGSVTDEQLMNRSLTGVAPDGSVKLATNGTPILPPMLSAFHSDEYRTLGGRLPATNDASASSVGKPSGQCAGAGADLASMWRPQYRADAANAEDVTPPWAPVRHLS